MAVWRNHTLGRLGALLLLAAAGGCAGTGTRAWIVEPAKEPRTWPANDATARIRLVGSIQGKAAAGKRHGVSRLLFGNSDAGFMRPAGIAGHGDLLAIADVGSARLHVIDLKRRRHSVVDKAAGEPMVSPVGIAVSDKAVYVSDSALGRVFRFDCEGRFQRTLVSGLAQPTGLAFDSLRSELYVAETHAHRIAVFDSAGRLVRHVGERGRDVRQFNFPTYLHLDRARELYVVDSLNHRVQRFDAEGRFVAAFGRHGQGSGDFASPKGIALDQDGHIYVVDALFDLVQVFDAEGQLLTAFGERGTAAGQMWLPAGIYIDASNQVFVADSYNQRVQVYQYLGGGR
jgi:DNA-binding beta-propeller fold protein YncE